MLQREIELELSERGRYYPESMLSTKSLIVEEFIGSAIETSLDLNEAELAVDMFYDDHGEPVVVGLYHHPHPSNPAYFHTLYYTSRVIYERFLTVVIEFFKSLQATGMSLRRMPLHAEFKIMGNRLKPIEINPYRFGGYGLADLLHHACGINPYKQYFEFGSPDWNALWKGKDALYGCVVGYNGEGLNLDRFEPDREAFKAFFGDALLHYQPLDHLNCPLFAMAYLKTRNIDLLEQVLTLDYRRLFRPNDSTMLC